MKKNKVCLVFPRFKYESGDPPMGVAYLAAYLKMHNLADVRIVDTTFTRSFKDALVSIKENAPDIVGIYSDTIMARDALNISSWAKDSGFYTVMGGPQPSVTPDSFMKHADVVVIGEGELIFAEVVKRFGETDLSDVKGICWKKNGEIVKNEPNNNFVDLDSIPFPDRGLLPMRQYAYNWSYLDAVSTKAYGTTMITSRGCPFSCSYCQPTLREIFGKKLRSRSAQNVIEEVISLKQRYGISGIFFHDDTLTVDKKWVEEFCGLLEDRKLNLLWGCNSRVDTITEEMLKVMHRAGLRVIHFGIESGSQRILDQIYDKKIKLEQAREAVDLATKIGIHTLGFFMIGAPGETESEINRTISFARGLKLQEATFSLTTPLVGTYLFDMLTKHQSYSIKHNFDRFDYYSKYSIDGGIGPKKIKFLQFKALVFFYTRPFRLLYIMKHLFTFQGVKKLINKIRRFL